MLYDNRERRTGQSAVKRPSYNPSKFRQTAAVPASPVQPSATPAAGQPRNFGLSRPMNDEGMSQAIRPIPAINFDPQSRIEPIPTNNPIDRQQRPMQPQQPQGYIDPRIGAAFDRLGIPPQQRPNFNQQPGLDRNLVKPAEPARPAQPQQPAQPAQPAQPSQQPLPTETEQNKPLPAQPIQRQGGFLKDGTWNGRAVPTFNDQAVQPTWAATITPPAMTQQTFYGRPVTKNSMWQQQLSRFLPTWGS